VSTICELLKDLILEIDLIYLLTFKSSLKILSE